MVALGSPRIGPLIDRYGTPRIIAAGMAALVVGFALFLLPRRLTVVRGADVSDDAADRRRVRALIPGPERQATAGVADHEQGLASGLVNTSFQLGGAIGLAIVTPW